MNMKNIQEQTTATATNVQVGTPLMEDSRNHSNTSSLAPVSDFTGSVATGSVATEFVGAGSVATGPDVGIGTGAGVMGGFDGHGM